MPRTGTGHIERLPSGSYRVHVYAGTDPLTGLQLRHRQTAKTEEQALILLGQLLEQAAIGRRPESGATVADLLEQYMAVAELDPSTRDTYEVTSGARSCPRWVRWNCGNSAGRCWTRCTRGCAGAATSHAPAGRSSSTSTFRPWRSTAAIGAGHGSRWPRRSGKRSVPDSWHPVSGCPRSGLLPTRPGCGRPPSGTH
jgi:hypothetical protein